MAPPDTVDNAHATGSASKAAGARRSGWPMSINDTSTSVLAPFLSNLPSMGISSLKGLLPLSPAPQRNMPSIDDSSAIWQDANIGNGVQRLLLLTSPVHALQMFSFNSGEIPDDQHIQEVFPAPEEVVSIPEVVYLEGVERCSLPGVKAQKLPEAEQAVSAHLLDKALWGDRGPVVALIMLSPSSRSLHGRLALVLVSLRNSKAFHRLDLGSGVTAAVSSTPRVIVVSTSHPTPSIYILNKDLHSVQPPVTKLPANPRTLLPVSSVSGRLLAYATREPAAIPGGHGLGSIVAASTSRLRVPSAGITTQSPPPSTQSALLSSAVEIGGGVARGMWAGLKLGARVAGDRLAQSAPSERVDVPPHGSLSPADGTESRSVEDGLSAEGPLPPPPPGGVWVKIVDVFPRHGHNEPPVIAHFRLPPSRILVSSLPAAQNARAHTAQRQYPISLLSFSPEGSRLFAAAADGRDFHILDIRPRGAGFPRPRNASKGEVWDAYVLRRGNTVADVSSVSWSSDQRWISVCTSKGTVHVFPISPAGGKPTAASHVPVKITNPSMLQPLSIEVTPFARLRPPRFESTDDFTATIEEANKISPFAIATFVTARQHPLLKGSLCQDIAVYRAGLAQMELARLTIHARVPDATAKAQDGTPQRRGSNLTEMMREKAGLRPEGDLAVEQGLKARWAMPLGQGKAEQPVMLPAASMKDLQRPKPVLSLYHAEIRTLASNPRILPTSIYLCRQVDFFAAVPTDEYSPLSVLDKVARTRRLVFRPEVEVHHPAANARSFDEPLTSALHSVMETRLAPQLPQLPNGLPSKASLWSSIPIRHVAANLGEGVDRVRREYVRAQHSRQRRRASNAAQNSLSFEEDAVLAARPSSEEDLDSTPSSMLPTNTDSSQTNTDSSQGGDDEWGEPWEDEYRRAVEDDGPDDLVLGLMDEEEEERRKWETRQKQLASEYQK